MDLIKWQNRICSLLMLLAFLGPTKHPEYHKKRLQSNKISPCCDFPCQNGGLCFETNNGYFCDCVNTGYYGKNCTYRFWSLYLKNSFNDFLDFILFNPLNFLIFNSIELLHTLFHSLYIENLIDKVESNYFPSSGNQYLSLSNAYNACLGTQLLPPLPSCPGKGVKNPGVDEVFRNLLERKEFVKNQNINLLFVIFGQNLALQFKHCNYVTWMTCSQLYKENERSFKYGKLKVYRRQGEDFPRVSKEKLGWIARGERAKSNYLISQNTMTYLISTIWLREHNRICNLLVSSRPDWDDERIFQTARNIVTGQMLSITYTEWINKLSYFPIDLRYKPLRKSYILANSVPIEIFMAFHWPQMIPEQIQMGTSTNMSNFILAMDPTQVFKQGLYKMISSLAKTEAGQPGPQNIGRTMAGVAKMLINEGRYHKLPMFNQYRSYLGLDKYRSFSELIGSFRLNEELKKLYGNIENLEFVTGLLLESGNSGRLLGQTSDHLITNWIIKAIMTHPLSSNAFWKSTTLGGKMGFEIIKKTTLKDLICRNVAEKELCESENLIGFDYKKKEKRTSRNFLNGLFNRGL